MAGVECGVLRAGRGGRLIRGEAEGENAERG